MKTDSGTAAIIGAGPAGLTAAVELVKRTNMTSGATAFLEIGSRDELVDVRDAD